MVWRLLQTSLRRARPQILQGTRYTSTQQTAATHPQKSILARSISRLRQRHPHIDPASLIASFLILHELTAVLPLFGVFGVLQWSNAGDGVVETLKSWTEGTTAEAWIGEAEAKAGRMLKKGYFAPAESQEMQHGDSQESQDETVQSAVPAQVSGTLTNVAASYLIVKVAFPLRLAGCFWLAPRCSNLFGRWAGPWTRRVAARWSKQSGQS